MTENLTPFNSTTQINSSSTDDIDPKQIIGVLKRQKLLVLKICALVTLCSGVYALTGKPVWKGQFEIVLADRSSSSRGAQLLQNNPGVANLIGLDSGSNQLQTEVEILESPSVLKPVFDFVKQKKQQKGLNVEEWRYGDWIKGKLKIELIKGTSVLSLSYKDTDKSLILPVIQKISKAYQDYSGRDRERGINQAIDYLDQQIKIYNTKSIASLRTAQEYGIRQNLTALQGDGKRF